MSARPGILCAALLVAAAAAGACGARRLELPGGEGRPFPGFEAAFDEGTAACRAIHTITAEIGVSGRVGRQRLRGRVLAGLSRPASLRLEGVAPFGPPAFILVSTGDEATLLLPRDRAVLQDEEPAAIIEALVGVPLSPASLQSILAGCGVTPSAPVAGRAFADGWLRIDLAGGAAAFLRQDHAGRWAVRAAVADSLRVEYAESSDRTPRRVVLELEGDGAQPPVQLRLQVAQVDINVALGSEAFAVNMPPDAIPITLDELRQAGPLGQR
ncbi:MAG TPA: hypothetical protein VK911_01355 [Vicinamibacterales bacterium]|nr:hypothetical protein [Vicinamibacterales bacterium]